MNPPAAPNRVVIGQAHRRFAQATLAVFLLTTTLLVALLVVAIRSDRSHEEAQLRDDLLLEAALVAKDLQSVVILGERELARHGPHVFDDTPGGATIVGAFRLVNVDWVDPSAATDPLQDRLVEDAGERTIRIVHVGAHPGAQPATQPHAVVVAVDPDPRNLPRALRGVDTDLWIYDHEGQAVCCGDPKVAPRVGADSPGMVFDQTSAGARLAAVVDLSEPGSHLAIAADPQVLYASASHEYAIRVTAALLVVFGAVALQVGLVFQSLRVLRDADRLEHEEDAARRLGDAAHVIAHEVKNALNNLRVAVDLLRRQNPALEDSRAAKVLRSEIDRLSEFSTELLVFSRGAAPRVGPVDLARIAFDVAERFHPLADERDVDLRVEAPPEVAWRGDALLLHLVVMNLVGNALDAILGAGAGRPARVTLTVERDEASVRVIVDDNGPGLSPEHADQLWQPFFTTKSNGVGLGLPMARRIARAHGGELLLERARPGARFVLTLPLG